MKYNKNNTYLSFNGGRIAKEISQTRLNGRGLALLQLLNRIHHPLLIESLLLYQELLQSLLVWVCPFKLEK